MTAIVHNTHKIVMLLSTDRVFAAGPKKYKDVLLTWQPTR